MMLYKYVPQETLSLDPLNKLVFIFGILGKGRKDILYHYL